MMHPCPQCGSEDLILTARVWRTRRVILARDDPTAPSCDASVHDGDDNDLDIEAYQEEHATPEKERQP